VGTTGAASASATIDLIWADTGTNEISSVNTSSTITLRVILTAGPNGSQAGVVSVDYSDVVGTLAVDGFMSTPDWPALPVDVTENTDTGTRITSLDSASLPPVVGTGLSEGQSHQLGTVTFHKTATFGGVLEIRSDANGPTDGILDLAGNNITPMTTFNSAYLIDPIPEPCDIVIEINALRGGSPTAIIGSTKDITARARIAKGTAVEGTTFDTTLQIDAFDGSELIDSQSSGPIRLEIGKGGQGDTLGMNIDQCNSGSIHFKGTFFGTYRGARCEASRTITKTCNQPRGRLRLLAGDRPQQ